MSFTYTHRIYLIPIANFWIQMSQNGKIEVMTHEQIYSCSLIALVTILICQQLTSPPIHVNETLHSLLIFDHSWAGISDFPNCNRGAPCWRFRSWFLPYLTYNLNLALPSSFFLCIPVPNSSPSELDYKHLSQLWQPQDTPTILLQYFYKVQCYSNTCF